MYLNTVRDARAYNLYSYGRVPSTNDPGESVLVKAFQEASTSGHFDDIKGLRRIVAWYMMAEGSSSQGAADREVIANFSNAYALIPVVTLIRRLDSGEHGLVFDLLPIQVDGVLSRYKNRKKDLARPELRYAQSTATLLAARAGDRATRMLADTAAVPVGSVVLGENFLVRIHRNQARAETADRYDYYASQRTVRDLSAYAAQCMNEYRDVWFSQRLVWTIQAASLNASDLKEHVTSASQLVDVVTQDRALVTSLLGIIGDWDTDTLFRACLAGIISSMTLAEIGTSGIARVIAATELQVPDHLRDMLNSYDRVGHFYTGRQLI